MTANEIKQVGDAPPRRGWRRDVSDSTAALTLVALAAGCVWVLLSIPRPVVPSHPPPLLLDRQQVREVLTRDRRALESLRVTPIVEALEASWVEKARVERDSTEPLVRHRELKLNLRRQLDRLRDAQGEAAIVGLRARALQRLESLLDGKVPRAEASALLGSFPEVLQRYHALHGDEVIAPRFVVRTLYAARWNLVHDLPVHAGFSTVETLAYHGWLALHADHTSLAQRAQALEAYATLEGRWAEQARGVLAHLAGNPQQALRHFEAAHRDRPSWRLRNYSLAARQALAR